MVRAGPEAAYAKARVAPGRREAAREAITIENPVVRRDTTDEQANESHDNTREMRDAQLAKAAERAQLGRYAPREAVVGEPPVERAASRRKKGRPAVGYVSDLFARLRSMTTHKISRLLMYPSSGGSVPVMALPRRFLAHREREGP